MKNARGDHITQFTHTMSLNINILKRGGGYF